MSAYDDAVRDLRRAGCVFAEREADVIFAHTDDGGQRRRMVAERVQGAPLEYVVGFAEFAGVTVHVGAPAFIPRHRAAALVDVADRLLPRASSVTALDLGCGCGAIAAALADRRPGWRVHATEVDAAAAAYARTNGATFGFAVHVGDWFDGLPTSLRGALDLVVAHLPYVPSDAVAMMPRDFRGAEPRRVVDGGSDGLDPWRAVAPRATAWLASGGALLSQLAANQVEAALAIGAAAGWRSSIASAGTTGEDNVVVLVSRLAG